MADLIDRQAAIKAIEDLQDCYNGFSDTYDKACIIGVLEEIPTAQVNTPTDTPTDTISRQAAIDALADYIHNVDRVVGTGHLSADDCKDAAISVLADLPSAQQDTPTVTYGLGKWIEKEDDGYHGGGYTECSVCGQRYSWGGYFEANEFRYCPRCGHRMEVEEDE